MSIDIKHRVTGAVLFHSDKAETRRDAVIEAVAGWPTTTRTGDTSESVYSTPLMMQSPRDTPLSSLLTASSLRGSAMPSNLPTASIRALCVQAKADGFDPEDREYVNLAGSICLSPEWMLALLSRLDRQERALRLALENYKRNLASEEANGSPHMGDDEHEAIAAMIAALADEGDGT